MGKLAFVGGGAEYNGLPSGYTRLAYIQSSGTQYINTGFYAPTNNLRVVLDFEYTADHSDATLFGSELPGPQYSICPWGPDPDFFVGSTRDISILTGTGVNNRFVLSSLAVDGNFYIVVNGLKNNSTYTGDLVSTIPMYLFANNINGAAGQLVSMKVYSCQIYDNDNLARDYVPCVDPNGNIGLYDLVEKVFYGNAGTGVFLGSEVA